MPVQIIMISITWWMKLGRVYFWHVAYLSLWQKDYNLESFKNNNNKTPHTHPQDFRITGESLVNMLEMSRGESAPWSPAAGGHPGLPAQAPVGCMRGTVGGAHATFFLLVTEGCGKDVNCLWLALYPAARKDLGVYLHFSEHQSLCSHLLGHFVGKLSLRCMTWHFLSLPQIPSRCLSALPWTYLGWASASQS